MAYNAEILLGRILKVHGFDGTVAVKLNESFINNIPEMESVFLEIDGKPVPFFISSSESQGADLLRLKFTGYDSSRIMTGFIGCRVLLTSGETTGNILPKTLSGFIILLPDLTRLGTIKDVLDNHGQLLLIVVTEKGRELLIPFHKDFIVSVNKKRKILKMDLPEGLTDINRK